MSISNAPQEFQEVISNLSEIYTDPATYVSILAQLIGQYGYEANTQSIIPTSDDVTFAMSRRICLDAIYQTEPTVEWQSSTDALAFRDSILPLFLAEITYSGDNDEVDVFEYFNGAVSDISKDVQTRGYGLPDLISYTTTTSLPPCVIAENLYGDGTRDDEIVIRNNPIRPLFMPLTVEVLSK